VDTVLAVMASIRSRPHVVFGVVAVLVAAVLVGGGIVLAVSRHPTAMAATSNPVQPADRLIPPSVAHIPLLDQDGHATDLAAFHGRIVVLADFMTSCQEECPITTGALLTVEQSLAAAHLLDRVEIVEASVDSWRDTPIRLRAYQKVFDVPLTMLTGTQQNLARLWSFFGVLYERVPESNPPDIDWESGRPYTFDINHSDDTFILGQDGNERALVDGNANVYGKLSKKLTSLLDAEGQSDLKNAGFGSWTSSDMLQAIGGVLGQSIPPVSEN
jgi:protein SCO1/2